jgi:3'(2'), 5'-bisphosphate nucleotidase
MMTKNNYHNLLITAIKAALVASEKILEIYKTDFSFTNKADLSPVTLADKQANEIICDMLKSSGIKVLSEESEQAPWQERKNQRYLWIVDPLDGTKEFIKKNDEFTVNIALTEFGTPISGVVYCPVLRELFYGSPSVEGAYKVIIPEGFIFDENNPESLFDLARKMPFGNNSEGLTVVVSRSHRNEETEKYISKLEKEHASIRFVSRGSSLKLCMIAEGIADIYPRIGPTHEWDTAAGHAIVRLSGGNVYEFETQKPLLYNKENTLNPWFVAVNSNYKL